MWRFSKSIGCGLFLLCWALATPSPILAQSMNSPESAQSSLASSDILSQDDLRTGVTLLLKEVSPELKPTLIQVLKDSSARLKQGSEALSDQKLLWMQDQTQLIVLSLKISDERMAREIDKWIWVGIAVLTAYAIEEARYNWK